jgi:hypothetical protein
MRIHQFHLHRAIESSSRAFKRCATLAGVLALAVSATPVQATTPTTHEAASQLMALPAQHPGAVALSQPVHASALSSMSAGLLRAPQAPLFSESSISLTLQTGSDNLTSAVVDTARGFAYFGTGTLPGRVIKVNLANFTQVATLTLNPGEDNLSTAVIDTVHGYAYFGTNTSPGLVVKVNISSTFSRVGALSLTPLVEDFLTSSAIDPTNGFAYFGTSNLAPGAVVKVSLNGSGVPTRVGVITLDAGEDFLTSAVIDTSGGYAYFGATDIGALTPTAHVVKVQLTPTFTRTAGLQLVNEINLNAAVIDAPRGFAYFGAGTDPADILKINLTTLSLAGTLHVANPAGQLNGFGAGVIDLSNDYAYFGTNTTPIVIAKVQTFPGFTTVQTLTLNANEDYVASAVIDPAHYYAYFGLNTTPGAVARVVLANSQTTLTSSANPSVYGQAVTLSATVTPLGIVGTPTGNVTFTVDNGAVVVRPLSNGVATYTPSTFSVGAHVVTATYGGNTTFSLSEAYLNQTVTKADTASALVNSLSPSVFGQAVTFTATVSPVSPGAGASTGLITFSVDGVTQASPVLNGSATATFTTASLSVGPHTITATYSGDASFNGSATSLSQVVHKANSNTVLVTAQTPTVFGQAVMFTATVTAQSPSAATPTGGVTFTIDGNPVSSSPLNGDIATYVTSTLAVGAHVISATYAGDAGFNGSVGSLNQAVVRANSQAVLAASANPSIINQAVTFTATVTAQTPGVGLPTGVVSLSIDGTAPLALTLDGAGQATYSTSALLAGTHSVSATYGGDVNFAPSNASLSQVVNPATTNTAVAASLSPTVYGQAVTFTAAVVVVEPGAGTPTGTVTFAVDDVAGGPVALTSGAASFSPAALSVGTHTVTAAYNGVTNYSGSAGSVNHVVNKADTALTVTTSLSPTTYGQIVTFTALLAAVPPGAGTPTGLVTFTIDGIPASTPTLSDGVATFSTAALGAGVHTVAVIYDGDANFNGVTHTISQTVNKAATGMSLMASANPVMVGQTVTLTAAITVAAPGAGAPTGSVTFTLDSTTVVTAPIISGSAVITSASLIAGPHTIVADYGGEANFASSTATLTPRLLVASRVIYLPVTQR